MDDLGRRRHNVQEKGEIMEINGKKYVVGQDRNDDTIVSHLYRGTFAEPGQPMCLRGWNRSGGEGYSIFRDAVTNNKVCRICMRRAKEGKEPMPSRKRKTKWL
jgi:hypothetical protein